MHHRDTIGSDQLIRPGELGLMTAGHGIAHAEQSPPCTPRVARRAAVGGAARRCPTTAPAWQHAADLPVLTLNGATGTVFMGALDGAASPGTTFSPMVGVDLDVGSGCQHSRWGLSRSGSTHCW